ncbi:Thoeris anti-defense Tad2 family protein [Runella salmonicolor]|uniref:Thoeris anti-defense 2-like domain-containing protein n=1 Tax=Runella salmonicolor TaxID=2950278 RepID=A0ABT1FSW2_9BACT|nr:hypothetical protein [Runella salmonicolor]MCP1384864.1 hypothetical protein [Runella salmonicolor]
MKAQNLTWGQASELLTTEKATVARRPGFENEAHIVFRKGKYPEDGPAVQTICGLKNELFEFGEAGSVPMPPTFRKVENGFPYYWTPRHNDLLAEDWQVN